MPPTPDHHSCVRAAAILGVATSIAMFACKDDRGDPPPSPGSPVEGASSGSCEVKLEGTVAFSERVPGGPSAVATDYWMSDADLRGAIAALEKDPAKVEEALRSDPRLMTLLLNCNGERANISFMPKPGSKYADVPYGPKKYELAVDRPGSFQVSFLVDRASYRVSSGTLDVTRFDDTGIAGTFAFEAAPEGGTDKVKVAGTLDFPCPPAYGKCKR